MASTKKISWTRLLKRLWRRPAGSKGCRVSGVGFQGVGFQGVGFQESQIASRSQAGGGGDDEADVVIGPRALWLASVWSASLRARVCPNNRRNRMQAIGPAHQAQNRRNRMQAIGPEHQAQNHRNRMQAIGPAHQAQNRRNRMQAIGPAHQAQNRRNCTIGRKRLPTFLASSQIGSRIGPADQ
jgi:hypothetical protein